MCLWISAGTSTAMPRSDYTRTMFLENGLKFTWRWQKLPENVHEDLCSEAGKAAERGQCDAVEEVLRNARYGREVLHTSAV